MSVSRVFRGVCCGAAMVLVATVAGCGGSEDPGADPVPNVAGDYAVRCPQLVEFDCPVDVACAIRDAETAFTLTQSGSQVRLTQGSGAAVPARVDAEGAVEVTLSEAATDGPCAITRTRSFAFVPGDREEPAHLTIAVQYDDSCAEQADCEIEVLGRLDTASEPQAPCADAPTDDPCINCNSEPPPNIPGCEF